MGKNVGLGTRIAKLRKKKGLTQDQLAQKAGISYSTLAKLERGAISAPSVFTVAEIAKILKVPLDEIVSSGEVHVRRESDPSEDITFVYCDVNGVLVRFFHKAFPKLASETGISVDRIETAFWHYNDSANRGEITTDEFNKAMEQKLGLKAGDFNWQKRYMEAVEPIKTMQECLADLSKNVQVGLLSDNNNGFTEIMIKKGLLPDLNYAAIVESAGVGSKKPDQKIYEVAEEKAGVDGKNIFFVDDYRANLVAAERRGWRVLWFDDYRPKESANRVKEVIKAGKSHSPLD